MPDNIAKKSHDGDERHHPKEPTDGGIDPCFEELRNTSMEAVGGQLQKKLTSRHLSMIAIGGSVGTGLIIGTGSALTRGGPAAILIAYSLIGFVVYCVLGALGEIAAWVPLSSGFAGYAGRYIDPAMGFALGYCYWFKYLVLPPTQLTACTLVLQYWVSRDSVNPAVWISIFLVIIVLINLFGVRVFGEVEFALAAVKITTLVGLIILCLVLVCGGGPHHKVYGFKYWSDPGAFNTFIQDGTTGQFLATISVLTSATYAFLGTELICVTFGEAQNPRRNIPRAIRLTFWRIAIFYVVLVFFLGMLVPYDSPDLIFANEHAISNTASASPFVVAIKNAGISVLPGIMNGTILIFVLSAANGDVYVGCRTIYGLALQGYAPQIMTRTTATGVPIYSLLLSASFACLAYLNVTSDSAQVFQYFVNSVTIFGILTWASILGTHICFVRARRAQSVPDSALAYTAPLGLYGTYCSLFVCIIVTLFKNYSVFVHSSATGGSYGNFDYKNFITGYLGIPLYAIMYVACKVKLKTTLVRPETADLYTGKDAVDEEERLFALRESAEKEARSKIL